MRVGVQPAVDVLQLDASRAGLGLHIAFPGLLGVDVAGAGLDLEATMEAGGVNAPRPGFQLGILTDALIFYFSRTGTGFEERVRGGLDVIVDVLML